MSIHNPICRLVSRRTVGSGFGVGFGVINLCRSLRRRSRRKLRHGAGQNRRSGRPFARAHRSMPGARAAALLLSNDAGCLRALANVSASFDCNSPVLWPTTHCGRSWVPRWPAQEPRGGQRRKLSCERSSSAFPKMPAARPAPDRRPIPSLRSVIPQVGGQARFALKRSTASVALGSAPSSFARWDSLLLLSRPVQSALGRFLLLAPPGGGSSLSPALGGLRELALKYAKFLLHSLRLQEQPTLCHMARAASARPNTRHVRLRISHRVVQPSDQNVFQSPNQTSHSQEQRSKSVTMPLIELAPHGKDVSLSVTLPEETANDVKLYARFLKATHQSATSDIISECIRRTLKQDAEFQTWKSDPANIKTNRGGARPRKAGSPTPPQTK
jgi:hypothetical protein